MERKALLYWLAQLGVWGAYYTFSVILLISSNDVASTVNLLLWVGASFVFSIILSHGLRWAIIRFDILSLKLHLLLIYTLILTVAAAFLLEFFQYSLDNFIELDFMPEEVVVDADGTEVHVEETFGWAAFLLATMRSIILFSLWSGFYYVYVIIEKSRKQEMLNLQWQASKNEIELKNLRAQLNPHFLFNSLNSIRALVGINPDQAKSAITQLSGLLRNSINLGKQKVIPLRDELELVNNYLKLEQIRFEERLRVKTIIDEKALDCLIPPLMLQTIVENAIKHGISQAIYGGEIIIRADKENGTLSILIENTGKLELNQSSGGVGITNSKKRLAILFGEETEFRLFQDGDFVKAQIKITYQ